MPAAVSSSSYPEPDCAPMAHELDIVVIVTQPGHEAGTPVQAPKLSIQLLASSFERNLWSNLVLAL